MALKLYPVGIQTFEDIRKTRWRNKLNAYLILPIGLP